MTPTCYRATTLGFSILAEQVFLKVGLLLSHLDTDLTPPSGGDPGDHQYSFLVLGVIYLSFIYSASFLPSCTIPVLPGTVSHFNRVYWPTKLQEHSYLLTTMTRYSPKTDKDSNSEASSPN